MKLDDFDIYNEAVVASLALSQKTYGLVFDASGLLPKLQLEQLYLNSFEHRDVAQYHNCRCCLEFIAKYGAAVVWDGKKWLSATFAGGRLCISYSTLWRAYDAADNAIAAAVLKAVNAHRGYLPLLQMGPTLGRAETGKWRHFRAGFGRVKPQTEEDVVRHKQTFERLSATNYTAWVVKQGLAYCCDAAFEKVIPQLRFMDAWVSASPAERLLLAGSPETLTHPKTTLVGSVLEAIQERKPFIQVRTILKSQTNPLVFQRPTAPIAAQQLQKTAAAFTSQGYDKAMHRAYFDLAGAPAEGRIWPTQQNSWANGGPVYGVFGNVPIKSAAPKPYVRELPEQSWSLFEMTLLQQAQELFVCMPSSTKIATLTEAFHKSAPPILRWDTPAQRNTVAWSIPSAALPTSSQIMPDTQWVKVLAVLKSPSSWGQGGRVIDSTIDNARFLSLDVRPVNNGRPPHSGLFPQALHAYMHEHKRAIELLNNTHDANLFHGPFKPGALAFPIMNARLPRLKLMVVTATEKLIVPIVGF